MTESTIAKAGRREWIGLAVLILPTLLIAMDVTVLHLAVPALTRALAPTSAELLWIVDIYGFLIAGSLITMGTLGDRIGRRKLLLIGAGAFGVASIIAAFSTSAEMLIAARALLGIAGATLMPSTQSLIRNMFLDPVQRTGAIAIWVSGFSAGAAIGPLLGGWLLESFWWGSVFLLGVPVMLLLLAVGPFLLPEFRDPNPGRFDLLSAVQSLAGVLLIIYGLKQIAESGVSWLAGLTILAGLVVMALFIRRQQTLRDPLLDLKLFANRAFSAALATNTLAIFFNFGLFLFTAQYLQLVLGLSPLQAGLWTLPSAVTFILGSNVVPKLGRWISPVFTITAGLLLTAIGTGLLALLGTGSGLAIIVASTVITSLGFGLVVTLTVDFILTAAPPERAGAAAALSETGFEFGGAVGIAVLGSIGTAIYRTGLTAALPGGVPAEAAHTARDTLGGALVVGAGLPDPLGPALIGAARAAFVDGLHVIAIISAIALVGTAALVFSVLRGVDIEGATERGQTDDAGDDPESAERALAA